MSEIHVVSKDNRQLYQSYFDPYFRLRHDIYVKQRKWMALDRPDGREIDQFDTDEAVYLFCIDDGRLIGGMRAVPTLMPTLMSEIFPYLNIRGPIHRPDVYELSRIFVIPERRGEHGGVPRLGAAELDSELGTAGHRDHARGTCGPDPRRPSGRQYAILVAHRRTAAVQATRPALVRYRCDCPG